MCTKCISTLYEGDDEPSEGGGDDGDDGDDGDSGSDSDEEEEWEEIYNEEEDDEGIRFLTFGGGPSGGYEVSKVTRGEGGAFLLWSWRQNWGTEREYILLVASRLLFKEEHYTGGHTIKYCRLVRDGLMAGANNKRGRGLCKESKLKEQKTDLEVLMMKCANSGVPAIDGGMNLLHNALGALGEGETSVSERLAVLSLIDLKKLTEATQNGNVDHKLSVISKFLNRQNFDVLDRCEMSVASAKEAVDLFTKIIMLLQFGTEDCSISWSKFSGEVIRIVGEKSAAAGAEAAGAPRGLGA